LKYSPFSRHILAACSDDGGIHILFEERKEMQPNGEGGERKMESNRGKEKRKGKREGKERKKKEEIELYNNF
jgi:hypothetical protein